MRIKLQSIQGVSPVRVLNYKVRPCGEAGAAWPTARILRLLIRVILSSADLHNLVQLWPNGCFSGKSVLKQTEMREME